MAKKSQIKATEEDILAERERFKDWLLSTKTGNANDYPSSWMRVDTIVNELGYDESILSLIVGRVLANKKKDAAALTLIVCDQLDTYHKEVDSASAWGNARTALKCYALRFLLNDEIKSKKDQEELKGLLSARKLAKNISLFLNKKQLRSTLYNRMISQDRKGFPISKINSFLSKNRDYIDFRNELIESIIFYAYDFINDPDHKTRIPLTIKDIHKLHFEKEGLCFIVTDKGQIYRLLTPTHHSSKRFRPAIGHKSDDFEIDHDPAIANELNKLKDGLGIINLIAKHKSVEDLYIDEEKLIEELRLLHENMSLRFMEKHENRIKSDK